MKSEEAIAGYFSWQKLLKKARAHVGLSSQMMMMIQLLNNSVQKN